jgi:hypothetical protein
VTEAAVATARPFIFHSSFVVITTSGRSTKKDRHGWNSETGSRAMKRRIITWVAAGAAVLGIGAAGVGAVVANGHSASSQSSAPVAAGSQSQTAGTAAAPTQTTPMMHSGETEGPDQKAQAGSVETGVLQGSGGAAGIPGAAGDAQGG